MSIITATDGYKIGHKNQYAKGTSIVMANWTPRKSRIQGIDEVAFFSQQAFIKKYLIKKFSDEFFKVNEDEAVNKYLRRINNYLPKGSKVTADHIRALHQLGYLPLMIMSLPEGVRSPIGVPQSVMFNTKDDFYWLVNYIETLSSCEIWKPCTSATVSHKYRMIFEHYANLTVGNTDFVPFQGHDFSMRGMSGLNDAKSSGGAHLLNFFGTDTIPAIDWLEKYYNANCEKELIGCSVNATEHSVMCSSTGFYIWDEHNGDWQYQGKAELSVFKRLITEIYPDGIVSIVSDTWDLWRVLVQYMVELKDIIMARDGKVVIRPDSGNPVDILCGISIKKFNNFADAKAHFHNRISTDNKFTIDNKYYEVVVHGGNDFRYNIIEVLPSYKGVVELLWDVFGGTISEKGYKVLDSHVGCIYGDSITMDRAVQICQRLMDKGFASINWVAGIGSYTYQYQTRDTFGYAQKSTYCEVKTIKNGSPVTYSIPIFKDPITDDGTKKSARGITAVFKDKDGKYFLHDNATWDELMNCELKPVFKDGTLLIDWTLEEVRQNMKK